MDINYYKQYEPIFGWWKITRLIGEGSYGKVFEVERKDFGVTYKAALKAITVPANPGELLSAQASGMDEASVRTYFGSFVQELVKEFAIMSKLKGNSNVVSYENHQVIEHRDQIGWDILIQMELLTPLNQYTSTHMVTLQDVIKLGIDLCKALELCQKYNIIHRDVKPENIFISEAGDFKLGDFGIARTVEKTTSGLSKKGTYLYMAPEVYKGEPYGSTVDIYSLGIVLYRLLNGNRTPFLPAAPAPITHDDQENALAKRFSGVPLPPPSHAQGRLSEIVLKACAYDPKERYSTPMQMRQELESILYNREERPYIYPEGDAVPQNSLHYVQTGETIPLGVGFPTTPMPNEGSGNGFNGAAPYPVPDMPVNGNPNGNPNGNNYGSPNVNSNGNNYGNPNVNSNGNNYGSPNINPNGNNYGNPNVNPNGNNYGNPNVNPNGNDFENWNKVDGIWQANLPPKRSSKRWVAPVIAGCAALCLLGWVVSSFSTQEAPQVTAGSTSSSASDSASETYEGMTSKITIDDYLQTVKDSQGRIISKPSYQSDGSVAYIVYEYNEQGDVASTSTYNLLGELEQIWVAEYNSDGLCVKNSQYDGSGKLQSYNTYTFENGLRTRMESYDSQEQMTGYYQYEYNDQGKVSRCTWYTPEGVMKSYYESEYDSQGRESKQLNYDENGFQDYALYEYNDQGRVTVYSVYDSQDQITRRSEYDNLGRTLQSISYDQNGKADYTTKYEYNQGGFCSQTTEYQADLLTAYRTYEYDERGKRITMSKYSSDQTLEYVGEYNEQGEISKESYYEKGALNYSNVYEYDQDGNCIKTSNYDADNALTSYTTKEYDDQGNRVEEKRYRGDDTLSSVNEYNAENRVSKYSLYDENGKLSSYFEYEYDENGHRVKMSGYESDGTLQKYTTYEYDAQGNVIKSSDYNGDGTLQEYMVSEYDKRGNHIKDSYYDPKGNLEEYVIMEYDESGAYVGSTWYNADGSEQ